MQLLSPPDPASISDASTDEDLAHAWQGGDERAFEVLFERYRGRAYGYALRMLRRPELADEVCTDTFCRVLERRWRPTGRFRSFLFTVLHRRCLEVLRRQSTWQRVKLRLMPPALPIPADTELETAGDAARVRAALHTLPDEQRSVLLLYYSQELSTAEVAQVLDCTPQQVRSKLSYARRKLREQLA